MNPTEKLAKELFDQIHLNWDFQKKETKDNFETLAKHVQRMVLEARIEEVERLQPKIDGGFTHRNIIMITDQRLAELRAERSGGG